MNWDIFELLLCAVSVVVVGFLVGHFMGWHARGKSIIANVPPPEKEDPTPKPESRVVSWGATGAVEFLPHRDPHERYEFTDYRSKSMTLAQEYDAVEWIRRRDEFMERSK